MLVELENPTVIGSYPFECSVTVKQTMVIKRSGSDCLVDKTAVDVNVLKVYPSALGNANPANPTPRLKPYPSRCGTGIVYSAEAPNRGLGCVPNPQRGTICTYELGVQSADSVESRFK